jgi:hypothetical protein
MKITLEFDGNEEFNEAQRSLCADKIALGVSEWLEMVRATLKYNDSISEEEYRVTEKLRDELLEKIHENTKIDLFW